MILLLLELKLAETIIHWRTLLSYEIIDMLDVIGKEVYLKQFIFHFNLKLGKSRIESCLIFRLEPNLFIFRFPTSHVQNPHLIAVLTCLQIPTTAPISKMTAISNQV